MVWMLFAAGLALLVLGAESLVRGASKLASSLGVPPLLAGQADIAVGNVVGSNI